MINEIYLNNLIHAVEFVNRVREQGSINWVLYYNVKIVGIDRLSDSNVADHNIAKIFNRIRQRQGDPARLIDTINVFESLSQTEFFSKLMDENNYDKLSFMINPTIPIIYVSAARNRSKFILGVIRKLDKWLNLSLDREDRRGYVWENYGMIRYDFGFIKLEDQDQYLTTPEPEPELSSKEILEKVLKESSKTQ